MKMDAIVDVNGIVLEMILITVGKNGILKCCILGPHYISACLIGQRNWVILNGQWVFSASEREVQSQPNLTYTTTHRGHFIHFQRYQT